MFGETTIFYIKIWNHPTETTNKKWLFRVPGRHHITSNIDHTMPRFKTSDVADEETEFGSPSRHWQFSAVEVKTCEKTEVNTSEGRRWKSLGTCFRTCFLFHPEIGNIMPYSSSLKDIFQGDRHFFGSKNQQRCKNNWWLVFFWESITLS